MFLEHPAFVLGANLPWGRYGCDFGANGWQPAGGLGTAPHAGVTDALAGLNAIGVDLVRWFLFCDGRAGIVFDADGAPSGLDPFVFADVDAALGLAAQFDVRVVFSLFDFLWCARAEVAGGVQTRGRRRVLADSSARAALLDRVVAPVVARYGSHDRIAAWEVINEPEWATFGVGTLDPRCSVRRRAMRAFIADAASVIHGRAGQPVTVGSAHASWLRLVAGTGLDFYQVHWYDRLDPRLPLTTPVSEFALDRPVVLGELPTRGSAWRIDDVIETARRMGYAGAWVWSLRASDGATDGARALAVLQQARGPAGDAGTSSTRGPNGSASPGPASDAP
jgi:hypothetical protein